MQVKKKKKNCRCKKPTSSVISKNYKKKKTILVVKEAAKRVIKTAQFHIKLQLIRFIILLFIHIVAKLHHLR